VDNAKKKLRKKAGCDNAVYIKPLLDINLLRAFVDIVIILWAP
jgi:hypothetical protein